MQASRLPLRLVSVSAAAAPDDGSDDGGDNTMFPSPREGGGPPPSRVPAAMLRAGVPLEDVWAQPRQPLRHNPAHTEVEEDEGGEHIDARDAPLLAAPPSAAPSEPQNNSRLTSATSGAPSTASFTTPLAAIAVPSNLAPPTASGGGPQRSPRRSFEVPAPYSSNGEDATLTSASTTPGDLQHTTVVTSDSGRDPSRSSGGCAVAAEDLSTPSFASMPRFGFPPAHSAAELAYAKQVAVPQLATCEQQWVSALRGVQMLAHAVPAEMVGLRRLSRKVGVPPHARGIVWLTLSGAAIRIEENEGFCSALLRRHGAPPEDVQQCIERDIERTFPEHPLFAGGAGRGVPRLRRVLWALCARNPLVDYCQSFNFLAALFLLFLDGDEEATFWMMVTVVEHLLPNDYFGANLVGLRADQAVLADLVKEHLPRLHAHFQSLEFDVSVLVPAWVMSLFVGTLPISAIVPVWDYLLTREPKPTPSSVPLAVSVAILKTHQDRLLACQESGEVLMRITELVQITHDGQKLVRVAHDLKVSDEGLRSLRRKYRGKIAREMVDYETEVRRIEARAKMSLQQPQPAGAPQRPLSNSPPPSTTTSVSASASPDISRPSASATTQPRGPRLTGSRARDSFLTSDTLTGAPRPSRATVAGVPTVLSDSSGNEDDGEEMCER